MKIKQKVLLKIQELDTDKTYAFSDIHIKGVKVDTIRKTLHRLAEEKDITIIDRGCFRRNNIFKVKVFIYGSLKIGFDNHNIMKDGAKKIAQASTVGKFAMFEDDFANYPYLVRKRTNRVMGELYEITGKEMLDRLDEFEGVPDYYQRVLIKVKTRNKTYNAYTYIRKGISIPTDQESMKQWQDDTDHKANLIRKMFQGV